MTVEEAIEILKQYPPNARLIVTTFQDDECSKNEVSRILELSETHFKNTGGMEEWAQVVAILL